MEIAGFAASLLIGLLLGLTGGGGSILTVPVLVYLFGVSPLLATSYSLFIVGITSLFGFISHYRRALVDMRVGWLFGIASVASVFFTRHYLIPGLPDILFTTGGKAIHKDSIMMLLFAALMIAASVALINGHHRKEPSGTTRRSPLLLSLYGVIIGFITGLLGAGGGFLLLPGLMFFAGLPIKKAVGTSLMIITLNSLVGVMADHGMESFHWWLLLSVTALSLAGLLAGMRLGQSIPAPVLKKGFGFFVLLTGISIMATELIKL